MRDAEESHEERPGIARPFPVPEALARRIRYAHSGAPQAASSGMVSPAASCGTVSWLKTAWHGGDGGFGDGRFSVADFLAGEPAGAAHATDVFFTGSPDGDSRVADYPVRNYAAAEFPGGDYAGGGGYPGGDYAGGGYPGGDYPGTDDPGTGAVPVRRRRNDLWVLVGGGIAAAAAFAAAFVACGGAAAHPATPAAVPALVSQACPSP